MKITLTTELQQLISADIASYYRIIPESIQEEHLTFYIDESAKIAETEFELTQLVQKKIKLIPISTDSVNRLLSKYFRNIVDLPTSQLKNQNIETKDFVEKILNEANELGSSDIHIEIYHDVARIRFRIDGLLIQRFKIEKDEYPEIVNKIKIKANLDISEKRLPQDGRIKFTDFDIRISILPTIYGEKIVLRILGKDATNIDIEMIGLVADDKTNYLNNIKKTSGIVLISGPTGSGKTTTLYATLKLLNEEKRNILTVEDPVEYTLKGINQVQLKEEIGLTFASALRSFLRQDPDVIMLGEIRDSETAQMAIRAAMTGHLVLSTIHTNSALGIFSRLEDMGVPPYLIANTINCAVAQRLIRKLCSYCKAEKNLNINDWPQTSLTISPPSKHWEPVGCEKCHYTGYRGRKSIYEVISVDKEIALLIRDQKSIPKDKLESINSTSLAHKAYNELLSGRTSLEEVYSLLMN